MDNEDNIKDQPVEGAVDAGGGLPSMATEPYKGQGVTASVISRGAIMGGIGYALGTLIGNTGDRPVTSPKYLGMAARFWQLMLGGSFMVIGANSAMREARDAEFQHARLQSAFKKLYKAHVELRDKQPQSGEIAPVAEVAPGAEAPLPQIDASQAVLQDAGQQAAMAR